MWRPLSWRGRLTRLPSLRLLVRRLQLLHFLLSFFYLLPASGVPLKWESVAVWWLWRALRCCWIRLKLLIWGVRCGGEVPMESIGSFWLPVILFRFRISRWIVSKLAAVELLSGTRVVCFRCRDLMGFRGIFRGISTREFSWDFLGFFWDSFGGIPSDSQRPIPFNLLSSKYNSTTNKIPQIH